MADEQNSILVSKAQIAALLLAANDLNQAVANLADAIISVSAPLALQEQAANQVRHPDPNKRQPADQPAG